MTIHAAGDCVTVEAYFSKPGATQAEWDSDMPRVETVKILEQLKGYEGSDILYWVAMPEALDRECYMYEAAYC